jgi:large subunit ribosomal protein L25
MKKVSLSGSSRANVGKKDASALRNSGRVPCVIYGNGEQLHFSVAENALKKIVWSHNVYQVELDIDGKKHASIIQDIQFHPVTDRVTHIDFLTVTDKPVKIKLPVVTTGTAEGVKKGGRLSQNFRKLLVIGKIADMPENISINIEKMEIGDGVRVSELEVKGLRFLDTQNAVVVGVQTSRKVAEEEPTKEAAAATAVAGAEAAPAAEEKGKEKDKK